MRKKIYNQIYSMLKSSAELGIGHLSTGNNGFYPNNLFIKGKPMINFSLCDYMALSNDERVKEGAIKAIRDFGVYTAVSKAYVKLNIYEEAENMLSQIFNRPAILFPRTTLAHVGVLPIIIDSDDAIIIDHQAHASIRIAVDMLKGYGNYIETIRHNRIDILEERIKALKGKYSKIWYLADGVYSMYGDMLPSKQLYDLMNKYEQFHVYVDDAHGMSWTGENGKGCLLNTIPYHPHMVVTTSLGKGFGAGGGAVICYDQSTKDWISTCAAPLIFTSPVTPATLGAIIESAKIHLSPEIYSMQDKLRENIDLFNNTARGFDLPLLNSPDTPLLFIAAGQTEISREICYNMMNRGFFLSVSQFPAVPVNNSGLRATITLYHSKDDIIRLLKALKEEFNKALDKRHTSIEVVLKHYKTERVAV